MEIILRKDVQNLGFKDDVVAVKPGYGRNYLIPQGFAHLATPSAKKVLAENLKQRAHKEAKIVNDAKAVAEVLKTLEIKIAAKAGGEKLFGSITNNDLAEELAKAGHTIERKFITSGIIKRIGKYSASIRLHRDVVVDLPYEIVAERA
ncbi:50S ribosomal protein L9 [Flavobacterium branchiophilum]|uniref:Large ribosomal subunit protein bL9 n=1 Tax=Flavobacterium branchiophilum TaxID=55197 RepID=A0A543G8I5_9FLAO|nr:50S ribosomal protein L9 [Flavobacterium branchiophilum]OXA74182.1 50S ribosomal protein L9 [Flavobacterium branchiophilum] [Flavobacterium branchiophilum NBRC 15030 = ATCC 35035]TQM42396.1 large subunit ribosomal protein L9 [Flavobacterium branchiophilum]GEM54643.1 50S ribosomal protein L9 [Flavobacterium branchiophilum NBRC 15030 = ATCC 35035]